MPGPNDHQTAAGWQKNGSRTQKREDEYAGVAQGDQVLLVEEEIVEEKGPDTGGRGGDGCTGNQVLAFDAGLFQEELNPREHVVTLRRRRGFLGL